MVITFTYKLLVWTKVVHIIIGKKAKLLNYAQPMHVTIRTEQTGAPESSANFDMRGGGSSVTCCACEHKPLNYVDEIIVKKGAVKH